MSGVPSLTEREAPEPHRPEGQPNRVAELEAHVAELELTLSRAREEVAGIRRGPEKKAKRNRTPHRR